MAFDLVKSRDTRRDEAEYRILEAFANRYLSERTDAKPSTLTNYRHAKIWMTKFFGEEKLIAEITPADCIRWQRFLNESKLASATVEKLLKRAKTMFRHAVRDRILEENPFDAVKIGASINRDRDAFITPKLSKQVLQACPSHDWKVVFALARYAGMRSPSETLSLRWDDINWEQGRIRVDSVKTGLRTCPLFAELRPILRSAYDARLEGATLVVASYRGAGKNLRTQLRRIIEKAGLRPWPKLFVNLRATRRTELQEQYPDHVVNAWLGHSSRVAEKHYLQVTPDHWEKAAGGNMGGNIPATHSASIASDPIKNPEDQPRDGDGCSGIWALAPPAGLEPATNGLTAANIGVC